MYHWTVKCLLKSISVTYSINSLSVKAVNQLAIHATLGNTGRNGLTGASGVTGIRGDPGATGISGLPGAIGATGLVLILLLSC